MALYTLNDVVAAARLRQPGVRGYVSMGRTLYDLNRVALTITGTKTSREAMRRHLQQQVHAGTKIVVGPVSWWQWLTCRKLFVLY